MSFGATILRLSLLANCTLLLALVSILDPAALVQIVDRTIFWQHDQLLATLEFYGLAFLVTGLVAWVAGRSIKSTGAVEAPHAQG